MLGGRVGEGRNVVAGGYGWLGEQSAAWSFFGTHWSGRIRYSTYHHRIYHISSSNLLFSHGLDSTRLVHSTLHTYVTSRHARSASVRSREEVREASQPKIRCHILQVRSDRHQHHEARIIRRGRTLRRRRRCGVRSRRSSKRVRGAHRRPVLSRVRFDDGRGQVVRSGGFHRGV